MFIGTHAFVFVKHFIPNKLLEISRKLCPKGQAYVTCGKECAKTCSNLHIPCSKKWCEDGCVCPEGQVLHEGKCVAPDQCPCHRGGRSYKNGETYQQDCNTWYVFNSRIWNVFCNGEENYALFFTANKQAEHSTILRVTCMKATST